MKNTREIADIIRRTKNILILVGELTVIIFFSPISKYDNANRKKIMVEARVNAPFISILSFFCGEEKKFFVSFSFDFYIFINIDFIVFIIRIIGG